MSECASPEKASGAIDPEELEARLREYAGTHTAAEIVSDANEAIACMDGNACSSDFENMPPEENFEL